MTETLSDLILLCAIGAIPMACGLLAYLDGRWERMECEQLEE